VSCREISREKMRDRERESMKYAEICCLLKIPLATFEASNNLESYSFDSRTDFFVEK